jgi:hypothetical protein
VKKTQSQIIQKILITISALKVNINVDTIVIILGRMTLVVGVEENLES